MVLAKQLLSLRLQDARLLDVIEDSDRSRAKGTPVFSAVGRATANATSYSETVASGTYLYRVRAFNLTTGKVSSYSNQVQLRVR